MFDWSEISLPSLTRLYLPITGTVSYFGGAAFAAFLTAHTALRELEVSLVLASIDELTAVFRDSTTLPQLVLFGVYDFCGDRWDAYDPSALLTALPSRCGLRYCWRLLRAHRGSQHR